MKRIACMLGLAAAAWAAGTAAWEMNTYQDFVRGRFDGLSLSRDGRLTVAPRMETLFSSDQPVVWSVARGRGGALYLATGHRGQVWRVDASGTSALEWTAAEPEVFAITVDAAGALYAGTSPDGKVYRIAGGKAEEHFAPGAKYIWSLAFAADGALFVGTGDQGRIFRVTGAGKGEPWYETGQSHVTCLAFDRQGRLLAGSEPNGILYRIEAKDKAFVLYDSNMPEIRSILPAPDGSIYAAALGGAMGKRAAAATAAASTAVAAPAVSAATTSITVTDEAQGGVEIRPKPEVPKPAAVTAAPAAPTILDLTGVEKTALYRIHPDHTVETLWTSKEENIYDLALSGGDVLFATDAQGRIYRLGADRKAALVAETKEGETTRLIDDGGRLLASTGNMGKLFRLGSETGTKGTFESPVHDAGAVARWGRLSFRGELPAGTKVALRTRSGNSARPDRTWSDWSEPVEDPRGVPVASPNARYIQWKGELTAANGKSPVLDSVTLAYLPQNTPPVVRSVQVSAQATTAGGTKPAAAQSAPGAVYSITVTDTGEAGASSAGTPTQTISRAGGSQIQVSWQAEDTDGDRLLYHVYFRGEEEQRWKPLKLNYQEASLALDGDILADGKYLIRVVASDSPSNSPGTAREAELVSAPVLIDNTPPVVALGAPRRVEKMLEIDADVTDAAGAVRRAEFSLNAGPWTQIAPEDGVADSARERFPVRIGNLPGGEHLLVIRAYDSAGNAGLAKVVLR